MGIDSEERKTLLYADLFKLEEIRDWRSPSSSACDSSSSESDDADFAAELSRQMAECMLHEEEEEEEKTPVSKYGLNLNHPVLHHAHRAPCVTKLKNQSAVGDYNIGVSRGRRVKGAELTQLMQTRKPEPIPVRKGHNSSGMRAIFLGGPGSRNAPSGTGVFLPRVTNNPVEQKKKSGLSTVLIPTRVLEALELHFTRLSDSSGSPRHASPRDERMREKGQGNIQTKFEMEAANKVDARQILPQEWTY